MPFDAPVMDDALARALLLRELGAIRRCVEAYPDDETVWATPPGVANSGGTLVLHVCGNLQHFIGGVLGATGYVRDRPAEFAVRGLARERLLAEVDAATRAVNAGLARDVVMSDPYPEEVGGVTVSTGAFLAHLVSHTAYHLGQLDYHRRMSTANAISTASVSIAELASTLESQGNTLRLVSHASMTVRAPGAPHEKS